MGPNSAKCELLYLQYKLRGGRMEPSPAEKALGVMVGSSTTRQHCTLAAQRANCTLGASGAVWPAGRGRGSSPCTPGEQHFCAARGAEPQHRCPESWGSPYWGHPNPPGCCPVQRLQGTASGVGLGDLQRSLPTAVGLGVCDSCCCCRLAFPSPLAS